MWSWSRKQSSSPGPWNITWSNAEVLPVCVEASPVSDSPCGSVDCVLWGMLIRLGGANPLSSRGLGTWAEIHQNICEVDLRLIEGLISSPLVFIRRRNGGKAGGFLHQRGLQQRSELSFPATGSGGVEPLATHRSVVYITTLLGALIHRSSLLFAVFLYLKGPEKVLFILGNKMCLGWSGHK